MFVYSSPSEPTSAPKTGVGRTTLHCFHFDSKIVIALRFEHELVQFIIQNGGRIMTFDKWVFIDCDISGKYNLVRKWSAGEELPTLENADADERPLVKHFSVLCRSSVSNFHQSTSRPDNFPPLSALRNAQQVDKPQLSTRKLNEKREIPANHQSLIAKNFRLMSLELLYVFYVTCHVEVRLRGWGDSFAWLKINVETYTAIKSPPKHKKERDEKKESF